MFKIDDELDFYEYDNDCAYFENERTDTRYKYLNNCSLEEYQNMLEHGWRRFGKMHFVPECKFCTKCVSIRIDVKNYKFSKSEKRVIQKNKDTKLYIEPPSLTRYHLDLYEKYHRKMARKKSWVYTPITPEQYNSSYVVGNLDCAKEFLYVRDNALIGVALVDILPEAISSIYCFYDHDYEEYSIGKFSILSQIKLAKELNIPYIYLGYWIKNHLSMGYKESYMPFEYLIDRANLDEKAIWEKYK